MPFLEHDDANRALMGSNMQRQAVPLILPSRRASERAWRRSAPTIRASCSRRGATAWSTTSTPAESASSPTPTRRLATSTPVKYQRTNQDTCYTQKPIVVKKGEKVLKGEVIADGPATTEGELALGRNILARFMPWNGYNYEDAILISESVVKEDMFSSIHIKEFQIEVRETKLGPERITRDIPNTSEKSLEQTGQRGDHPRRGQGEGRANPRRKGHAQERDGD